MSFSRNTILSAVFALSSLAMVAQDAQACPPRGGGFSRGYSSAYSYRRPSYSRYTPAYSQPYSQPVQVVRPVQPIVTQPVGQPVMNQPVQQVSQGQPIIPRQQPLQPQTVPQTPVQNVAPQTQPQVPQTQIQQQPLRPVQNAPVNVQQPAAPAAPATTPNSAAMSALQALGGFAPPAGQAPVASQPTQPVQVPAHVGNWNATLGNGASVRLTLQNDGSFVWVATNQNGNASSFSGRYTVGNGTLTLNRANDNQQLGGSMTISGGNAFSFKVAGNNAAAINFTRS
ncbi:MAG: hypothetical protein NXI04_08935 [Planctomycetaceae bacterium]|nr:hypothetical protein [Planctomycetaceae bacterium]